MFPFRRILVALAGVETNASLLDYAAMLGSRSAGAEFLCVHVAASKDLRRELELEREALARFSPAAGHARVSCEVLYGDRMDGLLEFATTRQTDLILLGHRINRSGRRSLARRLAMKAPCSVWMTPEGSPVSLNRILIPIDFSRQAGDAVEVATAVAESAGLDECHALHVHFNPAAASYDEYQEVIEEELDRAFCLFVAPIDLHDVHVKPLFVEGASVPLTIDRIAEKQGSDLVVMGTRGRTRSAAILLGSETEQTLRETRIPILAVKHFGARRRLVQVLLDKRVRDRGGPRFT